MAMVVALMVMHGELRPTTCVAKRWRQPVRSHHTRAQPARAVPRGRAAGPAMARADANPLRVRSPAAVERSGCAWGRPDRLGRATFKDEEVRVMDLRRRA